MIAWCLIGPAWVTLTFVVVPLQAARTRQHEYDADYAAARAGDYYREGLKRALISLSALEGGRTGWEAAIAATHPPTALRIERLVSSDEALRRCQVVVDRARGYDLQPGPELHSAS